MAKTSPPPTFQKGRIYRTKTLSAYASSARFNCVRPAHTGNYSICDCWIVDERGRKDPGLGVSPVPISAAVLGAIVK